jgi:HK97 family phage major capsid protein
MESKTEVGYLAHELRRALEQKDAESADVKQKISRIESELDKYEVKNAELTNKLNEERKSQEELKGRYEELEKKFTRMPKGALADAVKSPEYKAFENFIRWGHPEGKDAFQGFSGSIQTKYLRTDINTDGGYLAPEEYVSEIIKKITEISPVRQVSRVRSTTREAIAIPTRSTLIDAYWVGEGASYTEGQSHYGLETIKVNKLTALSIATMEMLTDAAFNMESEINQDIVERFAQKEGDAFINGDGVEKPEGILTDSDIEIVNSGVANDITADSLIEITGQLKTGYAPMFMLNRKTLARIRRLKDGMGQYLWQAGIADGQPNTIIGYPYVSAINVPDIAADAKAVIFGDFMRGYTIVDGTTMSMIRDDYTLASSGKVRFIASRRTGGQVVLPEAIKILKCAV